jgi:hypothetical protein
MTEPVKFNEQLETYFQNMIIEVDDMFSKCLCDKLQTIPLHLRTNEICVYFYTEMTRRIFMTTVNFIHVFSELTPEKAKVFLTDACHGKFDMEE